MRYALINAENMVINVIEYDNQSNWNPPAGCYIIASDYASIGQFYSVVDKIFYSVDLISS